MRKRLRVHLNATLHLSARSSKAIASQKGNGRLIRPWFGESRRIAVRLYEPVIQRSSAELRHERVGGIQESFR